MKEDIHSDYNNTVNEVKYAPIQEDQEQIEITGVGEISDTESTASMWEDHIEKNLVEILDPTTKVQVHIQASKVKKIDIHTKKEPTIRFWDERKKNSTQK